MISNMRLTNLGSDASNLFLIKNSVIDDFQGKIMLEKTKLENLINKKIKSELKLHENLVFEYNKGDVNLYNS